MAEGKRWKGSTEASFTEPLLRAGRARSGELLSGEDRTGDIHAPHIEQVRSRGPRLRRRGLGPETWSRHCLAPSARPARRGQGPQAPLPRLRKQCEESAEARVQTAFSAGGGDEALRGGRAVGRSSPALRYLACPGRGAQLWG